MRATDAAIIRGLLQICDARPGEKPKIRKRDFQGLPISLEYEAGERRIIRNDAGKIVYDRVLANGYGEFDGTRGVDNDPIDLILGPDADAKSVWVFDFIDLGDDLAAREDEVKVCIGFGGGSDAKAYERAEAAFKQMYGLEFISGVKHMTMRQLRPWLKAQSVDK